MTMQVMVFFCFFWIAVIKEGKRSRFFEMHEAIMDKKYLEKLTGFMQAIEIQ
jgi:hypothetical protein